jgi:hypothetical protein
MKALDGLVESPLSLMLALLGGDKTSIRMPV